MRPPARSQTRGGRGKAAGSPAPKPSDDDDDDDDDDEDEPPVPSSLPVMSTRTGINSAAFK